MELTFTNVCLFEKEDGEGSSTRRPNLLRKMSLWAAEVEERIEQALSKDKKVKKCAC